jgi:hypothetical protein
MDEDNDVKEYPELGALEDCPICGRENNPDEYDSCEHHWADQINGEIGSNDPKFLEFVSAWEIAVEAMDAILEPIFENSDDNAEKHFDEILDRYGFSEYAPGMNASTAFIDLVECFVGEERAGGLGGMGLSIEKTIYLENTDKIDLGIKKIHDLVAELGENFLIDKSDESPSL